MTLNYNYIKDNTFAPAVLTIDGRQVHNPTEAMCLAQGYTKVVPHTPTAEEIAEAERQAWRDEINDLESDVDND